MTDSAPRIIKREDGETIAYHVHSGKSPGVVFLTGLKSDMQGGKALALEAWCKKRAGRFYALTITAMANRRETSKTAL